MNRIKKKKKILWNIQQLMEQLKTLKPLNCNGLLMKNTKKNKTIKSKKRKHNCNWNFRDKWKILNNNRNIKFKVFVFNWTVTMKKRICKIQLNNSKTGWQIQKENSQIAT